MSTGSVVLQDERQLQADKDWVLFSRLRQPSRGFQAWQAAFDPCFLFAVLIAHFTQTLHVCMHCSCKTCRSIFWTKVNQAASGLHLRPRDANSCVPSLYPFPLCSGPTHRKQAAPVVVCRVLPVIHHVRRHGDLLAHHICKGQHCAIGVQLVQLLKDALIGDLVAALIRGDAAAHLGQELGGWGLGGGQGEDVC